MVAGVVAVLRSPTLRCFRVFVARSEADADIGSGMVLKPLQVLSRRAGAWLVVCKWPAVVKRLVDCQLAASQMVC